MFFDQKIESRIRKEELNKIDEIIRKDKDIYNKSRSNFVRIATLKLIREHEDSEVKRDE